MSDLLKIALLLSVTGSSWSCGKAKTAGQQLPVGAQQEPAALPGGCAIAAMINSAAFPASEKMWTAFLDARGLKGSELKAAGFEVQRDLTRVVYCATPSRQGAQGAQRAFVVIASGRIPGALLEEKVQNPGQATTSETVGQTTILGQGAVWIARRGPLVGPSQVLISNDHDLMVATLSGPAGSYPLEASDSFSAVIDGTEIRPQQRAGEHSNGSGLEAIHAVRLSISPQVDALTIRMVVNDQSVSDQLAKTVGVVLSALVKRALGEGHEPPNLSTTSTGGDVVARLVLPEHGLNSLMERMLASRARR